MIATTPKTDPNQQPATSPMPLIEEENEHEVRCGMCARPVFVDDETYRFVSEAIESGLDNPYRCEVCAEEYDDLAYEG
jgi:hypothetical protein